MILRFIRNKQPSEVSLETPLPVIDTSRERRNIAAEPVLISTVTVDTNTNRDLLSITVSEVATIGNAGVYRTLIWTGFKQGAADINYTVQARTTDADGNPLGGGWLNITSGTITGAANTWFRIVISQTDGLYYDQYRITVSQTSGSQTLQNKIVGVRG